MEHQKMTAKRLEQYRFLQHELETLRVQALDIPSPDCSNAGIVAYAEAELIRLQHMREVAAELDAVDQFIGAIEDIQLRKAISHRFLAGESWVAVAGRIGGRNGHDSVRKRVERYLSAF